MLPIPANIAHAPSNGSAVTAVIAPIANDACILFIANYLPSEL